MGAGTTVTAGTDINSTSGDLNLPVTSATQGNINFASEVTMHSFGPVGVSANIFIGRDAGNYTLNTANANRNIGIGTSALMALVGTNANEGWKNIATGYVSGENITSGSYNSFYGYASGSSVTTGNQSVCVGYNAGESSFTTGSYNVFLGDSTGTNYTSSESSNILIGHEVAGTAAESNVLRIGKATGTSEGYLNAAYIAGIYGKSGATTAGIVLCDNVNKLGTASGATGTVLVGASGAAPSFSSSPAVTTMYANTFDTNVATAKIQIAATTISTTGSLANIGLVIDCKGTGALVVAGPTQVTTLSFDNGTNLLSNYVDKTSWTPTLAFSGGNTGITYTTQAGYYSRIGNIVYYTASIILSSKGSSTGTVRLGGLPLTPWTSDTRGTLIAGKVTYTGSGISVVATHGDAYFTVEIGSQAGAAVTNMDNTHLINTSTFDYSGYYFV